MRQQYAGPLEVIIAEDGDDGGLVASIARQYKVNHLSVPRSAPLESGRRQYWTKNPPFGNLPVLRNRGIAAASHGVIIFQDAEVKHDTAVIEELATQVADNPQILVNCSMKMEDDMTGSTWHWRSHPTEPPCPHWPHVGTPNCIQKQTVLGMGGFEETMAGYGYDDDYFFNLLRKNKIEIRMTANSVATHQWHTGVVYDYPTGRANRALCSRLCHEIDRGLRPPIANLRSREVMDSIFPVINREVLEPLIKRFIVVGPPPPGHFRNMNEENAPPEFKDWATNWLSGKNDEHGDAAREMAEKMMLANNGPAVMLAESVWALRCWENAVQAGAIDSAEHLMAWARTAATLAYQGKGAAWFR